MQLSAKFAAGSNCKLYLYALRFDRRRFGEVLMLMSWPFGSGQIAFVGEIAALTAAFLWAAATLMFGKLGQQLSPLVLNIAKGLWAIGFIALTLLLVTSTLPKIVFSLPLRAIICLLLSGGIGIGLGDTAYFAAVNALGARRALLLETLAPPLAAVMAWIFLGEQLGIGAIAGITLTLLGVAWVISERTPSTVAAKNTFVPQENSRAIAARTEYPAERASRLPLQAGVRIALVAALCQSLGAVLSRAALADTDVDPLLSALVRLIAGLLFMGVLAQWQPQKKQNWQCSVSALKRPRLLGMVAVTAFFGTYLAIWLQQAALKYTATGIAQSLLATSPLFVLPMAALLGERVSWRAVVGVAIALSGVWLLFSS